MMFVRAMKLSSFRSCTALTVSCSLILNMSTARAEGAKAAFSPSEWREFPIQQVDNLSHDTKRFKIGLPSDDHVTGLTTASCIVVKGRDQADTKDVIRPYTPTTLNDTKGHFELVVKAYEMGNVSTFLHKQGPGNMIKVKGPFSKITYEPNMKKHIGMVAGGTGITPMFQVIQEVLKCDHDDTKVTLVYCNQ
ncbi:unnamed protein product, partial [Chrysoparadoxa australica]